jgi:branched-chain amino acid transport system ATP-binding protein
VLEVRNVHATYGKSHVLHGVSLTARAGEVVSLLGRNGAGKSTTLKAIVGLVELAQGEIVLDGRALHGLPTHAISRAGIGWVPEDRRFFADLTVRVTLLVGDAGAADPARRWPLERVFALFRRLMTLVRQRGGSLSGGEQQMLTIARTLMTGPRLLLLDEPSEGLAPIVVKMLADNIVALKREGLTILLSEQNLAFAHRLADRAYIIEKGEIKFEGTFAALDADAELRRTYLSVG